MPPHTRHVGPREPDSAAPAARWPWLGSWPGGDSADIQVSGRTAWEGKERGVMGNVAGAKETPNCPPPILGPKCKPLPSPHSIYGAVATYKRLGMGMCVDVGVHVRGRVVFNLLERGIPSADKKRGMLERSGKPWGEGGGAKICACTYAFARALTLPTSSGMRWGKGAQRHELVEGLCAGSFRRCLSFPA